MLQVERLSKTFIGQRALDGVDFNVHPAEVHALVGHNGSGKSTLMKILAGYHQPDRNGGKIVVSGTPLRTGDPTASHAAGLRFIHQELGLVEQLTVLENLRLGASWETTAGGKIRWKRERASARTAMARVGLRAHPDVLVKDLGAVQRTQVAVARALQERENARFLFFDEPTATLPNTEVDRLFELIRATVAHGIGVVYVSHRLAELFEIADRITVLRDGRVVGTGSRESFTRERLVELIVGRPPSGAASEGCVRHATRGGTPAYLAFDDVHAGVIAGMSFSVGVGEIVGMAGLVGSGVHDVPATLLGGKKVAQGTIRVDGADVHHLSPHELIARKVAVLPSERALRNIPTMTVRENLTLPDLAPLWRHGALRIREERGVARQLVRRFHITPPRTERPVAELSGGNQQKVSIAKWMRLAPRLLVLDEPTQGVDVGGRREILEILRQAGRDGVAILICSSDLEDLAEVCDRVLIVRGGRVGSELVADQVTQDRITEESYISV